MNAEHDGEDEEVDYEAASSDDSGEIQAVDASVAGAANGIARAADAWQSCHALRVELAIQTPGSLKCFAEIVFLLTTSHCSEIGV